MEKEKIIILFLFGLLVLSSLFLIVSFKNNLTGLVVGNITLENNNDPPSWITIPNQTWLKNTNLVLNLASYSSDAENYTLVYNYTSPLNISVSISNGNVTLIPDTNFVGKTTMIFSAYDYVNLVYSNTIYLEINSSTSESVSTSGSSGTSITNIEGKKEKKEIYYTDEYIVPKEYFLEKLFVNGYAILIVKNYDIIYLGDNSDAAYLYVSFIDPKNNYVLLDFNDLNGVLSQLSLNVSQIDMLDTDSDGLDEYYVRVDRIDNGEVTLNFEKINRTSISLFGKEFTPNYWWVVIVVIILFLSFFIYFLRKNI